MPVSLLNADTSFPSFTEGTSTSEKVDVMMNYLYMLLEELRYTFGNLGTENFNDKSLDELSVQLTKPVYGMIEDATAGLTHEFEITAQGLQSQISSVDGRVTSLSTTVDGLNTRVSDAEGRVSSLTQTVNGFETRVSNAEGKVSTLTQTVNTFDVKVTNAVNNANDAKTLAASLSVDVDDNSASISQIVSAVGSNGRVTAASIVSAVNSSGSSVKIRADKVDISGFVTFSDLSREGYSTINGSNITTGKIQAITITGSNFHSILSGNSVSGEISFWASSDRYAENKVGYLRFDNQGENSDTDTKYRIILDAQYYPAGSQNVSLKLKSGYRMSLESSQLLFLNSGTSVVIRANNGRGMINLDGDVYIRGTSLDDILASL